MCVFMLVCVQMHISRGAMAWSVNCDSGTSWSNSLVFFIPGLEVIKLEFKIRLKIKRNDWLLASSQSLRFILSLKLYSGFITLRPEFSVLRLTFDRKLPFQY